MEDNIIKVKEELLALRNKVNNLQEENFLLKSRKKYGLVWENKEEVFEKDLKNFIPILTEDLSRKIITDKNKPMHLLIEGDNYHVLKNLLFTHKEKVSVII